MTSLTVTEARENFAEVVNRVFSKGERVVIRRHGKDVVVLIPVDDLALLEKLEDYLDVEAAREALKEPGGIPLQDLKAALGL